MKEDVESRFQFHKISLVLLLQVKIVGLSNKSYLCVSARTKVAKFQNIKYFEQLSISSGLSLKILQNLSQLKIIIESVKKVTIFSNSSQVNHFPS